MVLWASPGRSRNLVATVARGVDKGLANYGVYC
jgi:hypothetical protein